MIIIDPNPALYTTPLSAMIPSFDINHHLRADDTQSYMSLSASNAKEYLVVLALIAGSKLKLNSSKDQTSVRKNNFSCLILGQDTNPSASTKNLGVVLDSSLNSRKHIIPNK